MKVTEAIILAGGKGTRLKPVVADVPKPMARICGKPFLEILIEHMYDKGVTHFVLAVGHMASKIIGHFDRKYPNIRVSFSTEYEALGTGGAIRLAFEYIKGEQALVLNGDSLFDVDLEMLEPFSTNDLPIIFGRHVDDVSRYGKFLHKDKKICKYVEKNNQGAGCINGGVYVLRKSSLQSFQLKQRFSIETDFFSKFSEDNCATVILSSGYFIDIGIPESYQKAQIELKSYIKK